MSRLLRTLQGIMGLHRRLIVDRVRYAEVTGEPLHRAISRKGSGFKEYMVTFADGSRMRIKATARREYADLSGPRALDLVRRISEAVLPGTRALVLRGGTGWIAQWLAGRVGPSGAVVSLEPDDEAARFAARRYRLPNVAFERGGLEALGGETEGGFRAVLAIEALDLAADEISVLAELWRLVEPGGWMLVACAADAPDEAEGGNGRVCSPERLRGLLEELARRPDGDPDKAAAPVSMLSCDGGAWTAGVIRRPSED